MPVVNLLYECALGTSEGGPHTAQDTVNLINATLSGSSQEVGLWSECGVHMLFVMNLSHTRVYSRRHQN